MLRTRGWQVFVFVSVLAASGMFLAIAESRFPPPFTGFLEDSYILLRYARNVAEGHGPVWNVGEPPVEGFTSLAWMLMIAGADRTGVFAGGDAPPEVLAARTLGLTLGVLTILVLALTMFLLIAPRYRWLCLLFPFHFALDPYFLWHAVSGMETMLVMFFVSVLMLLSAVFLKHPRAATLVPCSTWAAMGPIVRPELVLLSGVMMVVLAVVAVRRGRMPVVRTLLSALAVPVLAGVALAAWKLHTFGTLVPPPLVVKGSILFNVFHLRGGLNHVANFVVLTTPYMLVLSVCVLVRRFQAGTPAAAWLVAAATHLGYYVTVVPTMGLGYRYLMPVWPILVLLVFLALTGLLEFFRDPGTRPAGTRLLLVPMIVLLVLYPAQDMSFVRREARRVDVGHDLRDIGKFLGSLEHPEEICIATTECGNLPFYSRTKTVDLAGLNDPDIAAHFNTRDMPWDLVMRHRPDIIFMWDPVPPGYPLTAASVRTCPDFADYREVGRWHMTGDAGPLLVRQTSPRLNDFIGYLEFRRRYLQEHPEDMFRARSGRCYKAWLARSNPPSTPQGENHPLK